MAPDNSLAYQNCEHQIPQTPYITMYILS